MWVVTFIIESDFNYRLNYFVSQTIQLIFFRSSGILFRSSSRRSVSVTGTGAEKSTYTGISIGLYNKCKSKGKRADKYRGTGTHTGTGTVNIIGRYTGTFRKLYFWVPYSDMYVTTLHSCILLTLQNGFCVLSQIPLKSRVSPWILFIHVDGNK